MQIPKGSPCYMFNERLPLAPVEESRKMKDVFPI